MDQLCYIFRHWDFPSLSGHFGYLGIFLFFITVDQVTPIPEEISLLTIGYLSSQHVFNPFIAAGTALIAFLLVDSVYFFFAASGNKFVKRLFGRHRQNTTLGKYKTRLKEHFGPTLFFLCFIPRMRMLGPIFSGIMKFPFKKFFFFDCLGLAVFTALYVILGRAMHNSLDYFLNQLETLQHFVFGSILVIVAILLSVFFKDFKIKSHE